MSDTPPSNTNDQPGSGWRTPASSSAWRVPEANTAQEGWRVPALPPDLQEEPKQDGAWHLPRQEDTPFTSEAVLEIPAPEDIPVASAVVTPPKAAEPSIAPEDALFSVAARQSTAEPTKPEALAAPEDLIFMLEHIDEKEDDFDTLQMSELVALANLAESQPVEALPGADSPMLPGVREAVSAAPAPSQLSPAERAVLQPGDPGDYARQQLAMLQGQQDAAPAPTLTALAPAAGDITGVGTGTAAVDPGDYARQQLAQLGVGISPVDSAASGISAAPALEVLNPREAELARRFNETQERVRSLRRMAQSGQLSQEDFLAQLRDLMILDDDQNWWMMGVETDTWYRAEGNDWVQSTPQVLEKETRVQQQQARDLNALVQQPLDYLPDSRPQPAASPQEFSSPAVSVAPAASFDSSFMPLPKDVPVNDPEATFANPNVIDLNTLAVPGATTVPGASFGDVTVPGAAYTGATVPTATAVDYGRVEAPYDVTEPPTYDEPVGAPLVEEATERQRQSTARTIFLVVAAVLILLLLGVAGVIAGALLWYQGIVDDWEPQIVALANYQPPFQTVTILDANNNQIATLGREGADRRDVPLEQVSPYFIHAVISLENERFYDDPGWDLFAILRAFGENLAAGGVVEGASTITQQVARNFVIQNTDVTAERKIEEIIVAGELTRRYSKNELLELYINEISFGNQTFGVEAAAQFYFGVSAADLNLPQAALLASIISAPSLNNPVINREESFRLMRAAMIRMSEVGCLTFLHDAPDLRAGEALCIERDDLLDGPVPVEQALVEAREYLPRNFTFDHPHFVQLVQSQLEEFFGADQLYRGGYFVTTTLDTTVQNFAERELQRTVVELGSTGVNTGAVVVIDPRDGAVLAMVGSPDFNNPDIGGQNNYSLTYRQPGSAIKPVVYAAALRGVDSNGNGAIEPGEYLTPATILWDVETVYNTTPPYRPTNFDNIFRGAVSLRGALQNSYNVPAIKAYEFIGQDAFVNMAQAMGIRFRQDAVFGLPTAVGATEVSLYDLTVAYATIANDGVRQRPYFIRSIRTADGIDVPLPARTEPVTAFSPGVAFLMQNILADDGSRQPAFGLNSALNIPELNGRVGSKSGTSDGVRDLWTVGFTDNRVVGVWLGNSNNSNTTNRAASLAAAPLWNQIMRAAVQGQSVGQFVPPAGTVTGPAPVCALTGTIAGNNCAPQRNEFYLSGQQPPQPNAGIVQQVIVDAWSGLIVDPNICNQHAVPATFAAITDAAAVNWMNTTNAGQQYARSVGLPLPVQQVPTQRCDINTPLPVLSFSNLGDNQTISGQVEIRGIAYAPDFQSYSVEFAPVAQPTAFRLITSSSQAQQVDNSLLATWDTSAVQNGAYIVQVTMISTGNRRININAESVIVNNIAPTATPPLPTAIPLPTDPVATVPVNPLPFDTITPAPTVAP